MNYKKLKNVYDVFLSQKISAEDLWEVVKTFTVDEQNVLFGAIVDNYDCISDEQLEFLQNELFTPILKRVHNILCDKNSKELDFFWYHLDYFFRENEIMI
jgi:hypothetical protein